MTYTFSGSAVTAQHGDVVVFEIWYSATQGKTNTYSADEIQKFVEYLTKLVN